ncbi:MAG TPA: dTDP-4-amino-4,6-dideoxygalactose transaminase, partial [Sphingomicrobium sp.]|nr:dTDP-4-amino-4,6-dideoxygalactose transaminase [Sphingomicrobium sp.]
MSRIPLSRPTVLGSELDYVAQSLDQGHLAGDGRFTRLCHGLIEQITASPKALLTHSCTGALEMMALLIDLKPGDEVILPSFTFVSTANAIVLRGATPVFVDIDPDTLTIDPAAAAAAVTPRTRAITAVHYGGVAADMDPLREIADRHGLALFEDAAQAVGSTYRGRPCGSLGDLGAISFHETKNVVSGEGGALTINDARFAERAEIIREKGTNRAKFLRGEIDKYTWVDVGSSYLPSEIVAAFLYAQLQQIDEITAIRRSIFDGYMDAFRHLVPQGRIALPTVPADRTSNGHIFYLLLDDDEDRNRFIDHMRRHDVSSTFHYVPLHDA